MAGLLTLVFAITVALQVMMVDGAPRPLFQGATNTNHLKNKVKGTWKCDDENKNSVCEDHCFTKENHKFDCKFTVKPRLASGTKGSHQRATAHVQERQMVEEYDVVSERRKHRNKAINKKNRKAEEQARQPKNNGKEPTDGLEPADENEEPADENEEPNPHKHAPAAAAANDENHQPVKVEGLCHCVFH